MLFAGVRPFLPNAAAATMLDWGCGDALAAGRMAAICPNVLLYDAAEVTRERLRIAYAGHARVRVLDEADLAALRDGTIDFILMNSVVQYLAAEKLPSVLANISRWLKPEGVFLLGDVIEPDTSMLRDAANLLRFSAANGFMIAAVLAMLETLASPYRQLRKEHGFACYSPKEMRTLLGECGFDCEMLPDNIAPSRHRRSYLGRKPASMSAG